jgi:hypothetical protein
MRPVSPVGISNRYGLNRPGIESRWVEGARFFAPVQTGPWDLTSLLHNGYRVFRGGVKRPGCGADPPPPSKCRGHERVGLYLHSPSEPKWPVIGRNLIRDSGDHPTVRSDCTASYSPKTVNLNLINVAVHILSSRTVPASFWMK